MLQNKYLYILSYDNDMVLQMLSSKNSVQSTSSEYIISQKHAIHVA